MNPIFVPGLNFHCLFFFIIMSRGHSDLLETGKRTINVIKNYRIRHNSTLMHLGAKKNRPNCKTAVKIGEHCKTENPNVPSLLAGNKKKKRIK